MTRDLATPLVVGDALVRAAGAGSGGDAAAPFSRLQDRGEHVLRGRSELVRIWTRTGSDPTLSDPVYGQVAR